MTGRVLRASEWLIWRACWGLPDSIRDERYCEWTAELPHILHDSEVRFALHRALNTLMFAADQRRCVRPLRQARAASLREQAGALAAWSLYNLVLIADVALVLLGPASPFVGFFGGVFVFGMGGAGLGLVFGLGYVGCAGFFGFVGAFVGLFGVVVRLEHLQSFDLASGSDA